ncbi:ClpXP protease specificity-enhancing factor [Neptuniibacter sp.]|uniref:ClpXP protease specificity-enhancing factor n=1 Tax=Neptuniibacter sp. TaxID=1962643 RepID=UPI003B5C7867
MTPSRPYLVKALYEWLLDNELTPHVMVDAEQSNVAVPREFVEDGRIILNILPSAVRDFYMGDDAIAFNARFSGQPMDIYIPMSAVLAVYARENGQGMGFGSEPGAEYYVHADEVSKELEQVEDQESGSAPKRKGPALKVVK